MRGQKTDKETVQKIIKIEKMMNKQKFKKTTRKILKNQEIKKVQKSIVSALADFNDTLNEFLGELLTDDLENQ